MPQLRSPPGRTVTAGRTWRCGHPRTEANSSEWVDHTRNQLRAKCRRCANRRNRERMARPEALAAARRRSHAAKLLAPLEPDDPRHGTVNGYNRYQCRCERCTEAIVTFHRVRRLKLKAKKLGIVLPRELTVVKSVQSLDARFGGDEPRIGGGVWDDPTGDAAIERLGA